MEKLFGNYQNSPLEETHNPFLIDINGIQGFVKESNSKKINVLTASIEELSSLVVADMIKSVRRDLASVNITSSK